MKQFILCVCVFEHVVCVCAYVFGFIAVLGL